ncbi:MAG: hypothetical protein L3K01_07320 [Thermoplasmata archaeon]|nr:hypothetical protein [Thermoplasmata archaeon]
MPFQPWSPRRTLLAGAGSAVAVVAIIVLLLLWGVPAAPPPSSPSGSPPPGLVGPSVNVTGEFWTTTNATVPSTTCPNCSDAIPVNGTIRLTLQVQGDCDLLGCSPNLLSVSVARPFTLESSSSSLPTAFLSNNASISIVVKVPSEPGNYTLHGAVAAAAPPPLYLVSSASCGASYADASGPYLDTSDLHSQFVPPPPASPGSDFSTNVSAVNPTKAVIELLGMALGTGFSVVATYPTFPIFLYPGATQTIALTARTPSTNGSGALQVTLDATVYGNVTVTGDISITVDPFVEAGWSFPTSFSMLEPNTTFVVNVTFDNASVAWYHIEFTGLGGSSPVTLVNAFPSGTLNVSGSPMTIQVTLRFPAVASAYTVSLQFTQDAEGSL